jgi:tripeptidyl-peptidase-1
MSYSYNEADLSAPYAIRQCNEYAKLGLMGVTLLFNSGDFGVAGEGGACLNANGTVAYFSNHD